MAYAKTLSEEERTEEIWRLKHVIEDATCDRDWAIYDLHEEFGQPAEQIASLEAAEVTGIVASIRHDMEIDAAGEAERGTATP